jgi:hypothetical protein
MAFGIGKFLGNLAENIPGVDLLNDMFKSPKYPQLPPEKVMPKNDEEARKKARRRSIARQRARSGRASTMLTNKETLG